MFRTRENTPGVTDLIAGQLDMYFMTPSNIMPHVKTGKVKLLASTGTGPSPVIDVDTPLVSSSVPGFEISSWLGLMGPAGMPRQDVERLNKVINDAMRRPEVQAQMLAAGLVPITVTPDQFRTRIGNELKRWDSVAKGAHIQID